jgi:hypothetical protein
MIPKRYHHRMDAEKTVDPLDGYCDACRDPWRREMLSRLEVVVEDSYGTLYRCRVCKNHFYFDFMAFGGGRFSPVDRDWIRKIWPDLELEAD